MANRQKGKVGGKGLQYCPKCRTKLPKAAMYCPSCGTPLTPSKKEREIKRPRKVRTEEFEVTGSELVDKVKALIHEGNIRRITIKNQKGKTLIEIPLTLGVIGAVLAPVLAAVGAIAAMATKCTIAIERVEEN